MIEVFNAVSNIAVHIENDVFMNGNDFLNTTKSDKEIHNSIFKHCSNIIEREFEKVRSVKGAIGKDKKHYCEINSNGKYLISYVSIDNIELIDVNFSIGSIFGIYENEFNADNLKAAIYITYGPTFQLVFATKNEGVKFFSYQGDEFLQQESIKLKSSGKINATAGIQSEWSQKHKTLIKSLFENEYRLRFSNSLSLDTHQILFKKGGLYSSPSTKSNPNGILESIFEAFPISFIIELANGEAIDGKNRILDIKIEDIHSKTPIYFGSKEEIERVKEILN